MVILKTPSFLREFIINNKEILLAARRWWVNIVCLTW